MIQSHAKMPEGFTPATQGVPPSSAPVLALRLATSGSKRYELVTAIYDPERRFSQWRSIDGDAITDSGNDVIAWREDPVLKLGR